MGLAPVAFEAPARRVGLTLALLESLARCPDHLQALLAPLDLGRYVQFRFIALGFVCGLCAGQ